MRLGKAIHVAILEPDKFPRLYIGAPHGMDRRTKEGKAIFAELEATQKIILTDDELQACIRIASNVRTNAAASILLEEGTGKSEQSLCWVDKEFGLQCKARLDWLSDDFGIVVDPKSTEDASSEEFRRSVVRYGYHRQAAWYLDAVEAVTGKRPGLFVFAVFEKTAPYACAFYQPDSEAITRGREENRHLLKIYNKCVTTGSWPGFSDEIQPIGLPAWYGADKKLEEY